MIDAFEKKVSGNEWLWQEVPMSRGEGMIEHLALSNTSAVVVERYVQDDPFGKSHTLDAVGNNLGNYASQVHHHKRMHGGVVEPVTGLYDFRNRWYSPASGSWLSRDPLGYVDSENLYQGIEASTLVAMDSFGLCSGGCSVGGGMSGWVWESDGIPKSREGGCSCGCSGIEKEWKSYCDNLETAHKKNKRTKSYASKAHRVAAGRAFELVRR